MAPLLPIPKFGLAKIILLYIILFASNCKAQQALPDCAKPCYSSFPVSCNNDPKCVCTDPQWTSSLSCCTVGLCSSSDYQAALLNWNQFCAPAGITINPDLSACPSASGISRSSTSSRSTSSSSTSSTSSSTFTTSSTSSFTTSSTGSRTATTLSSVTSSTSASDQSSTVSSTATSAPRTSSSSTPSSTSSTAPVAATPSPQKSQGLSSSAKVGIGLGVPLGVSAAAFVALLFLRYIRHKDSSRLRHSGNIAAAGLYPARDNYDPSEGKATNATVAPAESAVNRQQQQVGELHQEAIPHISREVEGSPAPVRGELG